MEFFSLSAGLLILGILRKELSALLWGGVILGTLGFFLFSTLVFSLIAAPRIKRWASHMGFQGSPGPWVEGQSIPLEFDSHLPKALPPGLRWVLNASWHFCKGRSLDLQWPLGTGKNRTASVIQPPRGHFTLGTMTLELRDYLGFIRRPFHFPLRETWVVWPQEEVEVVQVPLPAGEGEWGLSQQRRRQEDLLDVRKYTPGDDPRRLHWKLFAHLGELFLRIGEPTPPPQSRVWAALDPSLPPGVPEGAAALELLDIRIREFTSLLAQWKAQGWDLQVLVPGHEKVLQTPEAWKTALAGLTPHTPEGPLHLPPGHRGQILVLTLAGSPWKPLDSSQEDAGWSVKPLVFPPPGELPKPRPRWHRWIWPRTPQEKNRDQRVRVLKAYQDRWAQEDLS